ncbi:MAG: hypothetical protein MMC23_003267 [Stictis urceolatum]|nr:hypothetical protein [Stictis urceolata]
MSRPVDQLQKAEDEEAAEVDEPPEKHVSFERMPMAVHNAGENQAQSCASQSLLTKALLTSPNLRGMSANDTTMTRAQSTTSTHSAMSGISTMDLTSDGGLTSPARTGSPSPPLPAAYHTGLPILTPKGLEEMDNTHSDVIRLRPSQPRPEPPKRHITFACSRPTEEKKEEPVTNTQEDLPKRKCMLRFACPSKPDRESDTAPAHHNKPRRSPSPPCIDAGAANLQTPSAERHHRDSDSTVRDDAQEEDGSKLSPSSPKMSRSEALRFHEFAAAKPEEEGWILEKPSIRPKITVSDTLRKENAIRKLGEEAEEEALEEENDEDEAGLDDGLDDDDLDEGEDENDDDGSDDGNETDDEEGFADSDDESEADSEYQFWTPAITTAATSTDHLDHIRPKTHRTASESSIESMINTAALPMHRMNRPKPKSRRRGSPKMRPGTPELPDSTDFVCGTLDEDRPLEVAYLSCMEQRRIAKHGVLPQDVDPSFPTSEPDDEEDDDDDEEDEGGSGSDSHVWIPGKPDESDDGLGAQGSRANTSRKPMTKSPAPSPKRMRSPPPPKRRAKSPAPMASKTGHAARSPPPRRLFGQSPHRMRSPPPRNLPSPRTSRRGSFDDTGRGIKFPTLAQRPQLTHTKSLPRTPNPFWTEHRRIRLEALRGADDDEEPSSDAALNEIHSRGPIDIVQGLERKRQRRKEKFWRIHCRHANAKDKERRPPPGKGAQRMREVGLEMADRCRGYGQRLQLVLSV